MGKIDRLLGFGDIHGKWNCMLGKVVYILRIL